MTLRHRPMQAADIDPCVKIIASHPVIGPRYGDAIQDLRLSWFQLMGCAAKIMVVFEEVDGAAVRLLGSGISVFVNDEFMHVVKTPPFFWIGPELARRIARGCSPLLSNNQFREANSRGGLNLLSWDGCRASEDMKRPDVYNKVLSVFIEEHRGYRWKEIIAPQADTVERFHSLLKSGGMLLHPTDGEWVDGYPEAPHEIIKRPHVIGLSREIEMRRPGSLAGMLFDHQIPRFAFSASQQSLLLAAFDGRTDEEIAAWFGISLSAVKKAWRGIYDRVAAETPEVFPLISAEPAGAPERTKEKKRRLLAYLRDHPEELRPISRKLLPQRHAAAATMRQPGVVSGL
jgi:hypothetical protein